MEVVEEDAADRRLKELEKQEPLLQENPRRFVLFPIQNPDIWQFYKKAEGKITMFVEIFTYAMYNR